MIGAEGRSLSTIIQNSFAVIPLVVLASCCLLDSMCEGGEDFRRIELGDEGTE